MKVGLLGGFLEKKRMLSTSIPYNIRTQSPSDPSKMCTHGTPGELLVWISPLKWCLTKRFYKWEILNILNPVLATLQVLKLKITHWLHVYSQEQCPVYNDHKYATLGVTAHISFVLICPWLLREKTTLTFCAITHLRSDCLLEQENSSRAKTSTSKASWREPTAHAIKCVHKLHVLQFSMWK